MKAKQVHRHDELIEPGQFQFYKNKEGHIAGMIICCPGCNAQSAVPFKNDGPSATATWHWDENQSHPTLTPSVLHPIEKHGCGWHGWLKNGEWITA